jgi:hypothetical protein
MVTRALKHAPEVAQALAKALRETGNAQQVSHPHGRFGYIYTYIYIYIYI